MYIYILNEWFIITLLFSYSIKFHPTWSFLNKHLLSIFAEKVQLNQVNKALENIILFLHSAKSIKTLTQVETKDKGNFLKYEGL